jgi:hypothetical protein
LYKYLRRLNSAPNELKLSSVKQGFEPHQGWQPDPVDPAEPNQTPTKPYYGYIYNHCEDYGIDIGDRYVLKNTTKIYSDVEPYTGCVAMVVEQWNGTAWYTSDVGILRPCFLDLFWYVFWGS